MIILRQASHHDGTHCNGCPTVSDAGVAHLMGGRTVKPLYVVEIDGGSNLINTFRLCRECLAELSKVIRDP